MWWLALIQAGMSAAGNVIQGLGAANAADQNAAVAKGQALDVLQQGAFEAGQVRAKSSQVAGAEKAGYAAAGVDVTRGTPVQTMAGTRFLADMDVQQAHNNAARRAFGYQVQAQQYQDQAKWDRGLGLVFGVAGPALSGAGQAMGSMGGGGGGGAPNIAAPAEVAPRNRIPNPSGRYY